MLTHQYWEVISFLLFSCCQLTHAHLRVKWITYILRNEQSPHCYSKVARPGTSMAVANSFQILPFPSTVLLNFISKRTFSQNMIAWKWPPATHHAPTRRLQTSTIPSLTSKPSSSTSYSLAAFCHISAHQVILPILSPLLNRSALTARPQCLQFYLTTGES